MDALIKWAIIAAVVAALGGMVYAGWRAAVAEPYREQGRQEILPALKKSQAAYDEARALLQTQGKMLDDLAAVAKARLAQAESAKVAAQRRADAAETKVQTILALQPSVPDNPCASACKLLSDSL